ncbi:TolB family protein [Roseivirga pacifica]|uniref:TolB family protein n=1 Tax=Roseivirga pacifica TaxID=1267423 RepID=UPI003BAFAE86
MRYLILLFIAVLFSCSNGQQTTQTEARSVTDSLLLHPEEMKYFKNIKQLTFGGNNAEAYWSFDDTHLVFQSDYAEWGVNCDQIFITDWRNDDLKNNRPQMVSTGLGRTTCSYYLPGNQTIVYGSTHLGGENCPPVPERRTDGKYVWPIYESFDIFTADLEGNIQAQLTNEPGYDAEATVSPKGDRMVFTSMRTGDLELYTMSIDGTDVKQITSDLGYDGGAFFSPDGEKLIWRASRPKTDEEIKEYKDLLAEGLVMPTQMELYVANADGSDAKKITDLGQANWAPFFHPSGEKIIFASNHKSERGFPFNLYMINIDGTGLTRITHDETFDAFPVFSNDGKYLVFSSNRNNGGTRDTNLFVAEWIGG